MKINRKISAAILACVFALSFGFVQQPAHGQTVDELENRIEQIQQENAQRQEQIENLREDLSQYEGYAAAVQGQIDGVNQEMDLYSRLITDKQAMIDRHDSEIAQLELDIENNETAIKQRQADIALLQEENEENLERFGEMVAAMYKTGNVDYVTVLMGSESFYDMLVSVRLMNGIAEQNTQFMDKLLEDIERQELMIVRLNDEISVLEQKKAQVDVEKQELQIEMAALEAEKSEISARADEYYSQLYQYSQGIESLENQVNGLKSEINASNEQIEEINNLIKEIIRQEQGSTDTPSYSDDGFIWPLSSSYQYITTLFGYDAPFNRYHYGIDVGNAGIGGANVYAAQSGTVIVCRSDNGWNGGFGNYVIIDHGGGVSTLYAHMQENSVAVYQGQTVQVGQVIGKVGTTGWSTGNHLHFEVRVNGTAVNPFNYSYSYIY